MEYYYLVFLVIGILLFVWILSQISNKKKKKLIDEFRSNWGKVSYDKYFDIDKIAAYFLHTSLKDKSVQVISDNEVNDLDLNDVFAFINRTTSVLGKQYLYFMLRAIQPKPSIDRFTRLVTLFREDEKLRLSCQQELHMLSSNEAYAF